MLKYPLLCMMFFAAGATANAFAATTCDAACRIRRAESYLKNVMLLRSTNPGPVLDWAPDNRHLWYSVRADDGVHLYLVDAAHRRKSLLTSSKSITDAIADKFGLSIPPQQVIPQNLSYDFAHQLITLRWRDVLYQYQPPSGQLTSVEMSAAGRAISPDGSLSVFVQNDNLYVENASGDITALTSDGEEWYSFSPHMSRSNPRNVAATPSRAPAVRWIGNGPYFYIERWDFRKVGELWQIDSFASPRPTLTTQKMAFPGEDAIPIPELWIVNAASAQAYKIGNEGWAYLAHMDPGGDGIVPSRDGGSLYFARMNRDYTVVELCVANVASGVVQVLLREERSDAFTIRYPEFVELEDGFVWKSDRDGFHHYYLYDKSGHYRRQITAGDFSVNRVLKIDEKHNQLFFSAYGKSLQENPLYAHTYQASLYARGELMRLDHVQADHKAFFSNNADYFLDYYSRPDLPPQLMLKDRQGTPILPLKSVSTKKLIRVGWKPPELFRVTAADGKTPLYGVMWKPTTFDPEKRYPVVTHVYPGPAKEKVPTQFDPGHPNAALAELGFIVVSVEQRGGNSLRGKPYMHYARASGSLRDYPVADNKAALEQLGLRHPFMDLQRVGIFGHSGGGFMSATAMLLYPDFYKVGVASSGNYDNNIYEMNSSEFYFGHPRNGPAGGSTGYDTVAQLAPNLSGHLLLIHGDMDEDVPLAQSLRLMKALIREGKLFDTLVLPGETHNYSDYNSRYVQYKTWRYFLKYLMGLELSTVDLMAVPE